MREDCSGRELDLIENDSHPKFNDFTFDAKTLWSAFDFYLDPDFLHFA